MDIITLGQLSSQLHVALLAVCPVDQLRIVDPEDRTSWIFIPDASATPDQVAAGVSAFNSFVYNPPTITRTATKKQVCYALNGLGVRGAWADAVKSGTQDAQDYWAFADPLLEGNAKIAKWCAAAGITVAALFDQAVQE